MNWLDIAIALPFILFIYKGWRNGLVAEITSLLGVVLGGYAAIHFSTWTMSLLGLTGESAILIAFLITFIAVIVLANFLGKAVEGLFKLVHFNWANRMLGATFGMLKSLCIVSVLLGWLIIIDKHERILPADVKAASMLYRPTYNVGALLTKRLKEVASDKKKHGDLLQIAK